MQSVYERNTFLDVEHDSDDEEAWGLGQAPVLRSCTTSDLRKLRDEHFASIPQYVDDGTGWRKGTVEDENSCSRSRSRCLTMVSEGGSSPGGGQPRLTIESEDAFGMGCSKVSTADTFRERPSPSQPRVDEKDTQDRTADAEPQDEKANGRGQDHEDSSDAGSTGGDPDDSGDQFGAGGAADGLETASESCSLDFGPLGQQPGEGSGAPRRRHGPNQRAKRTEKRRLKRQAERASARAERAAGQPEAPPVMSPSVPFLTVVAPPCSGSVNGKMDTAFPSPMTLRPTLMLAAMTQANSPVMSHSTSPMMPGSCVPAGWPAGFSPFFLAAPTPTPAGVAHLGPPPPAAAAAAAAPPPRLTASAPTSASEPDAEEPAVEVLTTVMMRNIPNNYTRAMLLELLNVEGFAGRYDFVYVPHDFKTSAGLGFAFVNFLSTADAESFQLHFEGFKRWAIPSSKVCTVGWSGLDQQGLAANIKRYRNSSVMHETVPEDCRPLILKEGKPVEFPRNTRRLWPPHASYGLRARRA